MSYENRYKQDTLIAEHTLGLLSGQDAARALALLETQHEAALAALRWEERFLELVDCLPPIHPPRELLESVQAELGHVGVPRDAPLPEPLLLRPARPETPPEPAASPKPKPRPVFRGNADDHGTKAVPASSDGGAARITPEKAVDGLTVTGGDSAAEHPRVSAEKAAGLRDAPGNSSSSGRGGLKFWRAAAVVLAGIVITLMVIPRTPAPPQVTVVEVAPIHGAILQAPGQTSTPGWLLTIDPQRNIKMRPLVHTDVPPDASVQLWTHSLSIPAPRSLGLLDPNQPVAIPAALIGDISPDQIFEMTLEEKNGSPTGSPTGPILFIGRIVTFGQ
jgi:anti-sigma-K factor RskA